MGAERTDAGSALVFQSGEGEQLVFGRIIAADTFEILELAGSEAPPPHTHEEHDEGFYVLEGKFDFLLGDESVEAPKGTIVVVPRGTRHGFTFEPGSRLLALTVPAGLAGFFRELSAALSEGQSSAEIRARLAGKYDSHPELG